MSVKDTVDSIRREQDQLLRIVELLRERCGVDVSARIAAELEVLEERMREHVGLVAGVLDAVTEDDPNEPR